MKLFKKMIAWFKEPTNNQAELEIVEMCGQRPVYLVWEPSGFRNAAFNTFAEAKKYAERMGWKLV